MDEVYFWNKLEAEYGTININIRNVLKKQNLCSQSLSHLTIEGIQIIEEDMRIMAESLRSAAAAGGTPLHEIYGQTYAENPENFRFLRGEVMCLLDLAEVMKKKGIKYFLNNKLKQKSMSIEIYDEDAEEHSRALYEKIMLHFSSQGITDTSYDELLEQFKTIEIKVFTNDSGKVRAEALCPICQKTGKRSKLSFSMDERNNWHIYSLTRHSNTMHFQMPTCSSHKRRRTNVPTVTSGVQIRNQIPDAARFRDLNVTLTTENDFTNTASFNDLLSTPWDPLSSSLAENEMSNISSDVREEQSDQEVESMEEERIDEELDVESDAAVNDTVHADIPSGIANVSDLENSSEGVTKESIKNSALLNVQINIDKRIQLQRTYGVRYSEYELDVAAYILLTSGISAYKFKRANMHLPSLTSIQRHISRHTYNTREGILMVDSLVKYLTANNFPKVVALSEDGTSLSPNPEYSPRTDSIRGLVAPFDSKGMPLLDIFKASSAEKMINDLKKYTVGEYLYVVMATPMIVGASPFCLLYMCSNNKFTHLQVKQRWEHVEAELETAGVRVVCHASDGDPRLLRAMTERTHLPHTAASMLYGYHFIANINDDVVCIQDTIHLVNKFRHALLNPKKHMAIGKCDVSVECIKQMIEHGDKAIHKMNPSDLNPADKMKFDPTLKMIALDLIEHLVEVVPDCIGTVVYLKVMRLIYISFVEEKISPAERIFAIWTALFVVRAWRWQCLDSDKSIQQCTTSNVYGCLELNAHELVHYIVNCREAHDQFLIENLSSQPCEKTFRTVRSMTTLNHTAVNFTMKDVEQRMQRVQMRLLIAHRRKNVLSFPSLAATSLEASSHSLPNDEQIAQLIKAAEQKATELLTLVGFDENEINFTNSLITRNTDTAPAFESQLLSTNCQQHVLHDPSEEVIECAMNLFPKTGGEPFLKRYRTKRNKNIFKIRRITGKVVNVTKSKMLWIFSSGRFRRTNDRLKRFHRIRTASKICKT
ncbi:uncharacterized protein LOC128745438 [Sabethes cyaneus]|uniref:uncharacterized protein LOC128745438 n=1 Tax=Sabethes cyaneus TaxID=53552 RepID=UPI00237DA8A9|nr:uncharacterized protein LOC128745438 [Sabethes cyaneus]